MRAYPSWLLLVAGSAVVASSAPVQGRQPPLGIAVAQAKREAAAAELLRQRAERAAGEARGEAERLRLQRLAAAQAISAQEARISSADAEALLLRARLGAQRQALAREQAPVSSLLAGLAMIGRRPPLTLLAGANSPRELIKVKALVEAITPHIRARSAALATRLDEGRALEQAALAARGRAVQSRELLQRHKVELAALEARALQLAERSGAQAAGAGDVVLVREEQAALLERQGASGRRSSALAAELARLGPAPARPGAARSSPPPLNYLLPARAPISEGLGNLSDSGIRSRGVLLATRRGTPVVAPASGTVLFSGPFRDYDGLVIIDHGGGWRSILVNVGTVTARGSTVAIGERLGTALGPVEVQLQHRGRPVSAAIIAGSSALLSKDPKSR
ncbi:MAG: peptidoglycan DD-metalloendopeptidase family protein [Pseudomonadota bacterium]|nr:peptidoglycan DD-metalloendopeptidase family protein [Pseudomonadota bacterium]